MLKALKYDPITGKYEITDLSSILTPFSLSLLEDAFATDLRTQPSREFREIEERVLAEYPDWQLRTDGCVCSDQAFQVYGCMCRVRRMPG
jgi:hypothetical protein